ncbi:hypothetical protein [Sphingobacterium sp. SGR-19]|uniref:hypothetical protein n=1 Tax=Sphingobacterium sp. SGR-19 TaxID=2710886 RepID=UPI0013ED0762|nr:hypothetical protein [Sphingobacterium sp. SGR-19]NGM64175.1 hypothetical protein [Sphingobacterium sp. SGR-19]
MINKVMKNNSTFWGIMAAAAIMFSAGAGYAGSKNVQTATHYNAEMDPNIPANWQPITPGSPGESECTLSTRPCKAVQDSQGNFIVTESGDLPLN